MNDYGFGHFKARKDCNEEQLHSANADTLREIGKRYEKEIVDGAFCAYDVDDPNHKYYIARVKRLRCLRVYVTYLRKDSM